MKRAWMVGLSLCLLALSACQQVIPEATLEPQFGSRASGSAAVAHSPLGDVFISGTTPRGTAFLRRYTRAGTLVWERLIELGDDTYASGVASTPNGNTFLVLKGCIVIDPFEDINDCTLYLRKYNRSGKMIWQQSLSKDVWELSEGATDGAGNLFTIEQANRQGIHLRKRDTNGRVLWSRKLANSVPFKLTVSRQGSAFVLNNNFIYSGGDDPHLTESYNAVTKYGADGRIVWRRKNLFGLTGFFTLTTGPKEEVYLAYLSQTEPLTPRLLALDAEGTKRWEKTLNIGGIGALATDPQGNLYAGANQGTGDYYSSDILVRRYTSAGASVWTRRFGTPGASDELGELTAPSSGEVYLTGVSRGPPEEGAEFGSFGAFLMRLNGRGEEVWQRSHLD